MDSWNTEQLASDDKRYVWHPFTSMGEWCAPDHEPIVLVGGEGAMVRDSRGREYIDGNSSIWTNVHGHNHPRINAAIREQLERVAHTSFLGTTNPPAIKLAREIVNLFPEEKFGRVFYSDDGSTGMEAALRIVSQYWKLKGSKRRIFISFRNAYHGDTAGAASLGAAAMFGSGIEGFHFPVRRVASVGELSKTPDSDEVAAVVIEPIIQGAAGMQVWPGGTLRRLREWCDEVGALLIADEVMTGFGRTGRMFACEHENVQPDLYVFAKGLTGGYLPLAITLISHEVFEPFGGSKSGCDPLLWSQLYRQRTGLCGGTCQSRNLSARKHDRSVSPKNRGASQRPPAMAQASGVEETRSCGMIGAIDLAGGGRCAAEVCQVARERGLLTRHIRSTVTLMPPLIVSISQLARALDILNEAVQIVVSRTKQPPGIVGVTE